MCIYICTCVWLVVIHPIMEFLLLGYGIPYSGISWVYISHHKSLLYPYKPLLTLHDSVTILLHKSLFMITDGRDLTFCLGSRRSRSNALAGYRWYIDRTAACTNNVLLVKIGLGRGLVNPIYHHLLVVKGVSSIFFHQPTNGNLGHLWLQRQVPGFQGQYEDRSNGDKSTTMGDWFWVGKPAISLPWLGDGLSQP